MRTLVVEDDFVSRRLVQTIMSPYGACDVAVDGDEAVEAFSIALEEQTPYDLVCLDIMMPGMNGHEVLKRFRDMEKRRDLRDSQKTKVIMVTAMGDYKNVMNAFQTKCDAYLVKPIDRKKLQDLVASLEVGQEEQV